MGELSEVKKKKAREVRGGFDVRVNRVRDVSEVSEMNEADAVNVTSELIREVIEIGGVSDTKDKSEGISISIQPEESGNTTGLPHSPHSPQSPHSPHSPHSADSPHSPESLQ
eukprot:GHVN01004215.1.p2 GENE.GHVN01004215.1~~GHVN01004215.1.p2  ORF type:complete len:129 (-),score=92.86 GHVN01004215.1:543-878(-)